MVRFFLGSLFVCAACVACGGEAASDKRQQSDAGALACGSATCGPAQICLYRIRSVIRVTDEIGRRA
jgi:hypothetical protein